MMVRMPEAIDRAKMACVVYKHRSAERAVRAVEATVATVATLRCTVVDEGASLGDTGSAQDCVGNR